MLCYLLESQHEGQQRTQGSPPLYHSLEAVSNTQS